MVKSGSQCLRSLGPKGVPGPGPSTSHSKSVGDLLRPFEVEVVSFVPKSLRTPDSYVS